MRPQGAAGHVWGRSKKTCPSTKQTDTEGTRAEKCSAGTTSYMVSPWIKLCLNLQPLSPPTREPTRSVFLKQESGLCHLSSRDITHQ